MAILKKKSETQLKYYPHYTNYLINETLFAILLVKFLFLLI